MGVRVAILMHEHDRERSRFYQVTHVAETWHEQGHDVVFSFGTEEHVEADIAILHVNLSVVPGEWLEIADRYPIALNKGVTDIRKSTFSEFQLSHDSDYDGQVIVKSDLNYAGIPERTRDPDHTPSPFDFESPDGYRIYPSLGDVPAGYFETDELIVEQFLPEVEDGLYHVRYHVFLGDRVHCVRLGSTEAIVKGGPHMVSRALVDPDPRIVDMAHELAFDYGKFDYVINDGRAILLDTNKTPGVAPSAHPLTVERHRRLAEGLDYYLD